ncbi:MAG: ATP-binding cassette domain-containing protein [Myxococcaceae bacterium]
MTVTHLRLEDVSFSFNDLQLLDEVELSFGRGWTGVVGPNGSGKSTLLSLLAQTLKPGSGRFTALPEPGLTLLCEQRVDDASDDVRAFAAAEDGEGHRLRGLLQLEPAELGRWGTLSPGERKRWQVGAALHREPEVLLLDEPTNHLDANGRALLMRSLEHFEGVGVIVSHDRELLDALTTATVRLEHGHARHWPLPYSQARAQWLQDEASLRAEREEVSRQLSAAKKTLDQGKRKHEAAARQRSTGARMKNKHDSDQRGLLADYRAEQAEKSLAHANRCQQRTVDSLSERREGLELPRDELPALFLKYQPCPKPVVVSLSLPRLVAGDHVLLDKPVQLQVARAARLALTGENGAGKTTLLTALRDACTFGDEHLLWLPQELTQEEAEDELEQTKALPRDEKGRVLQMLDVLGVDPDTLLRSQAPSPGEARKLRLAYGLSRSAWLLLLDEPTNHLDLPSVERLEAALKGWPGAMVVCSHDRAFLDALQAERLEVPGAFT